MPPNTETAPLTTGPPDQVPGKGSVSPSVRDTAVVLAGQARRLIADLDGQRAREAAAFDEGYRLAFEAGRQVGYAQAEEDMARAWGEVAQGVRDIPRQQTVNARRYPGYTRERLAALRAQARERFGLPNRNG